MAIRKCEMCEELMQEGYGIETKSNYFLSCNTCFKEALDEDISGLLEVVKHDWTQSEMDDEDFEILMNILISDPSPSQIADVLDILDREDGSFYGPEGVLQHFITYLNNNDTE